MIETINKLTRITRRLTQEYGRNPTAEEIGEQLGLSAKRVREIIKISQLPISLELPMGEDAESYLGDFIADHNAIQPLDGASKQLLKDEIQRSTVDPDAKGTESIAAQVWVGRWEKPDIGRSRFGI